VPISCAPFLLTGHTFDLSQPDLTQVLRINSSEVPFPTTHVDFPNFGNSFDVMSASVRRPWEYVYLDSPSEVVYIAALDIRSRTSSPLQPIQASPTELKCSASACYSIDIDQACLISIDPMSGAVECLVKYSPSEWVGYEEDSSAFDRQTDTYYATLLDANNKGQLIAINIPSKSFVRVNGTFSASASGPYCFEHTSRMLISFGSALGPIVGLQVDTGAVHVLSTHDMYGLPAGRTLVCDGGELAVQIVAFHEPASPTYTVTFALTPDFRAVCTHNKTTVSWANIAILEPSA
jgi:hypothetical protein